MLKWKNYINSVANIAYGLEWCVTLFVWALCNCYQNARGREEKPSPVLLLHDCSNGALFPLTLGFCFVLFYLIILQHHTAISTKSFSPPRLSSCAPTMVQCGEVCIPLLEYNINQIILLSTSSRLSSHHGTLRYSPHPIIRDLETLPSASDDDKLWRCKAM